MKTLSTLLICSLFLFVSCRKDLTITSTTCKDTNCIDYTSQAAAQAAYVADPKCRADLDADKDGTACEEPGNSVRSSSSSTSSSGCPTTSNCGCSGKNKSPCEGDPCCKWIVGTGCKCR